MIRILTFTILISYNCVYPAQAQPDPITIQFVEAQPLWEHLVWDTSYYDIGNQLTLNKYNTAQPKNCYRFNNDLIMYSPCLNYNAEIYGYILEKLNIETGQTNWQSYNTYYNNGLQDYYKNLYLREDGKLEMIGIKRHGPYDAPILGYWNVGGGQSNFVRKVFDYVTGDLVQTIIGIDSIGHIIPNYLTFYPIKFDSIYLALNLYGEPVNDTIKYGYNFYQLNDKHNLVDTSPISRILFETSDIGNYFSYGQPQFTEKINDSTMLGLIIKDKLHPSKMEAQLIWINIKDLKAINVIKRLNIQDIIPSMEPDFKYFSFNVVNDLIYISQPYKEDNTIYAFLTCLDLNGNKVHYIPKCTANTYNYNYISLAYSSDDFDYFVGFPSKTGRKGFDILKLERNSDSFQYISSLTSANLDENFTLQMEVNKLYNDGFFVIGAFTEKIGSVENSALKYYCFKGSDLGMNLSTSVQNYAISQEVTIYPNPTKGMTNLHFDQLFSGEIRLVDITGKELVLYKISCVKEFQIDLENYPNGIYFITMISNANGLKKIIKIIND